MYSYNRQVKKEMAESIVDKIKAKLGTINLPFLKKKAPPPEAEDPEYNKTHKKMDDIGMDSAGAHMDKTNPGVTAPSEATEANNLEDMKAAEKPKGALFRPIGKTRFTPIHVIVVVAVGYFGYDMMMGEEGAEEVVIEETATPKPKRERKNKKKKGAEAETAAEASGATPTPSTETAGTGTELPSDGMTGDGSTKPESGEKIENIDVAATPEATAKPSDELNVDVKEINADAEKIEKETAEVKPTATPEAKETATAEVEASGEENTAEESTLNMTTGEGKEKNGRENRPCQ